MITISWWGFILVIVAGRIIWDILQWNLVQAYKIRKSRKRSPR